MAIAMAVLVERTVWRGIDAALEEEGETVCTLLASGPLESARNAAAATAREASPGPRKFMIVQGKDGQVVAQGGVVPAAVPLAAPEPADTGRTMRLGRNRHTYRVVWYASPGCTAVVGAGGAAALRTIRRADHLITSGGALLLLVLALLAWGVTSRATAEIGRLAAEVETIEAGSLDRRLSARRTLEVDRLAAVLNRLLARLEGSMDHLRRFTADAAHELRTPIAGLRARLEVTVGGPGDVVSYRAGVLDALEQTERLEHLAEDLLELSRIEAGAGESEPVRLDDIVREAAEFLEPVAAEQRRSFECHATTPAVVRGVPALLRRLVLNLLDNAFKHTTAGTAVRVTVERDGPEVLLEVADRGPGIAAHDVERVFDRVPRGRAAGAGAGLGLAICREIALRHGGTITIDGARAGGARVLVRLPPMSDGAA